MPSIKQLQKTVIFTGVFLASLVLLSACSKQQQESESRRDVKLSGRIDYSEQGSPVIIWQGSSIEFRVENANYADLFFSKKSGQVYFDLNIDGKTELFSPQNGANRIQLRRSDTYVDVILRKRNEASTGTIAFDGLKLSARGETQALPVNNKNANKKPLRFLFFGDSITAGACNEDGAEDQWEDISTHNALKSYAAITANNFDAEYQNISVSGMGISMGYTGSRFPETWNKLYPHGASPEIDTNDYQPDFVFINLGENDDSSSKNRGSQFPIDFDERYITMVKQMRLAYPQAKFVLLRGGMYGGSQSKRLIEPWEKVVTKLKDADSNLSSYIFRHWSSLHPRVRDHQILADELTRWLRANQKL